MESVFTSALRWLHLSYIISSNRPSFFTLLYMRSQISVHPLLFDRFHDQDFEDKLKYVAKYVRSHIEDGDRELKKPVTFTEFGFSNLNKDYTPAQRDRFYKTIFDILYKSAKKNGAGGGSFIWQLLVGGMEEYNDDFGIVPWERSSTYRLITDHTCRLATLQKGLIRQKGSLKDLCLQRR